MSIQALLIANRGEVAIRIARAAAEMGVRSVAVYAQDDAASLHLRKADDALPLPGSGPSAYLDIDRLLELARAARCDAVHPGYGFLSENAEFARRWADSGMLFVGPQPEVLGLFSDKTRALALPREHRIPVLPGTGGAADLQQLHGFFAGLGAQPAMMIKALAGGGGRGMRAVYRAEDIDQAYARCRSEALAAFGNGALHAFEPPRDPGVRVDSYGYGGYTTHPGFDSLLAKLVVSVPSGTYPELLVRAYRALCEFRIEGVETNIAFLQNLIRQPDVVANRIHTGFVEQHVAALLEPSGGAHRRLHAESESGSARARADATIPAPPDTLPLAAPMQGSVVAIEVDKGDAVHAGQQVAVIEAMKMEYVVRAETAGIVRLLAAGRGTVLQPGQPLLFIEPAEVEGGVAGPDAEPHLDAIRPDLAEVRARHAIGLDAQRPEAVARRWPTTTRYLPVPRA